LLTRNPEKAMSNVPDLRERDRIYQRQAKLFDALRRTVAKQAEVYGFAVSDAAGEGSFKLKHAGREFQFFHSVNFSETSHSTVTAFVFTLEPEPEAVRRPQELTFNNNGESGDMNGPAFNRRDVSDPSGVMPWLADVLLV
jgi:hypothetical protein